MRTRIVLLVAGLSVLGALLVLVHEKHPDRPGAALRSERSPRVAIDRGDRQGVIDGFYDIWLRNQKVPIGWTGSVSECRPGKVSNAAEEATRTQINYFRAMVGLRPVSLLQDLEGTAQRTALMMDANNQISHYPPDNWRCRTSAGDRLASRSVLALGSGARGARAISLYVSEPGRGNVHVGHRRWLFNPRTAAMSHGSTASASTVVVIGMPQHDQPVPRWMPWPSPGYFPSYLEPHGRWSLSTSSRRTDFSYARVAVTDGAGRGYAVRRHAPVDGMGPKTLVWQVTDLTRPAVGKDRTYHVRVTGIRRNGYRIPAVSWSVTLVVPDRRTRVVEQPVLRGRLAVGQELTVSAGTWAPRASVVRYQWYRDGAPIPDQRKPYYRLTSADGGREVTVRVSGGAPYYLPGTTSLGGRVTR